MIHSIFAFGAVGVFLIVTVYIAQSEGVPKKGRWMFPAFLSVSFFLFSLAAVIIEGPLGFWTEHIRHFWGNQIWFDLLLGIGVGWFLIVPQAKKVGMSPLPWLLFVVSTGSIGFLAMIARLLYLQETQEEHAQS